MGMRKSQEDWLQLSAHMNSTSVRLIYILKIDRYNNKKN